jgi:hypothetical protein
LGLEEDEMDERARKRQDSAPDLAGGRPVTGAQVRRAVTGPFASSGTVPSAADPGVDRRRADRAAYLCPARVLRGERAVDGRIQDLSARGLLISLPAAAMDVADAVVVRFALPISGTVVSLPAVAVRVARGATGVDVGLAFSLVPEESARELARYVAAMAPR